MPKVSPLILATKLWDNLQLSFGNNMIAFDLSRDNYLNWNPLFEQIRKDKFLESAYLKLIYMLTKFKQNR